MKYEFKGTKGTWLVAQTPKGKLKIVDVNSFSIATMNYENLCKQDANLISAAPDLLNACISLINLLESMENEDDIQIYDDDKEVIDVARGAIHKALNIQ